jgi:hypothetical protein
VPLVVKIQQNKSKAAAGEVISVLHDAKQEVAKELEANLKQLKSVLEDTQRIAKEMEAVLSEAKNEPSDRQKALGNWEPPSTPSDDKKQGSAKQGDDKQVNSKQGENKQKDKQQQGSDQQGADQQGADQQGKEKSAGSKQDKQDREIKVQAVTGRTYVSARPRAWVPPPYRTVPGSKTEPSAWEPPPEAQ